MCSISYLYYLMNDSVLQQRLKTGRRWRRRFFGIWKRTKVEDEDSSEFQKKSFKLINLWRSSKIQRFFRSHNIISVAMKTAAVKHWYLEDLKKKAGIKCSKCGSWTFFRWCFITSWTQTRLRFCIANLCFHIKLIWLCVFFFIK